MKDKDKVASFTILVIEESDGSMVDPNAELAEGETPQAQVLPKNGSKELARAEGDDLDEEFDDDELEKEENRSSRAKLTTRQGKAKVATKEKAPKGQAKAGFTNRRLQRDPANRSKKIDGGGKKLVGKTTKTTTPKAPQSSGRTSTAKPKSRGFTTKKLTGKTTKAKTPAKAKEKSKGFTKRKLK
jgi:hypothetical protein